VHLNGAKESGFVFCHIPKSKRCAKKEPSLS
jgi:hypothetical protein